MSPKGNYDHVAGQVRCDGLQAVDDLAPGFAVNFFELGQAVCVAGRCRHGAFLLMGKGRTRPRRPGPRVARQMAPSGVAGLGKGTPLPASRACGTPPGHGTIWCSNAACDETGTDPRGKPAGWSQLQVKRKFAADTGRSSRATRRDDHGRAGCVPAAGPHVLRAAPGAPPVWYRLVRADRRSG